MKAELEGEYVEYVTARMSALRRFAFLLCGDEHRADDLVPQTITRLYERWRRARTATSLDRYVRTMLLRAFLDERRRGWSTRVSLTDQPPEPAAPDAVQQAFVWGPDGVRQELPMPTIDGQVAVGFRARSIHAGVVTGQAVEAMDGGGWRFHTVRYDLATGQFTDVSAASPVYPAVVSRHGWVVGGGADGLAMWPGEGQPLPMPMPDLLRADDELPGPRYDLVVLSDDGRLVAGQVYGYDDDPPLGDGGEPRMTARAVVWHCD